jgi:PfaD family protein
LALTHKNTTVPVGLFCSAESADGTVGNIVTQLRGINTPLFLSKSGGETQIHAGLPITVPTQHATVPFSGMVLPSPLEALGDPQFCHDYGIRYPYLGGSMAKGISSVEMVEEFGRAGMLGFFGAAGLSLDVVESAINRLQQSEVPFGINLIHSPAEPQLEKALVDLYLRRGITLIEASAFLSLTLPIIRFRTHGIYRNERGEIITPNRVIAKVSREEVAARFFAPPPEKYLNQLVEAGDLTAQQAELAGEIPVAQDVTAEADSGGHTDNRPALALFPTLLLQREKFQHQYGYRKPLRVGLGGGIATPIAAAAAFSMGAAYLVTGSINQACVESGTCDEVRKMLSETRQADITMAPSGDMFEMGVKVQVVKRGTMFSIRAQKLFDLYRAYNGIDELPPDERDKLEKTFFRAPLMTVWEQTRSYFAVRDPRQVERADADPKHKMALVFRWYLGQSPVWANSGDVSRKIDYQIWCGPAMGAFNEWVRGSFLDDLKQRKVVDVAYNILFGAAVQLRANQLKQQECQIKLDSSLLAPLKVEQIKEFLS